MKRCIVFAHFDRGNIIDPHVIFYLRELRKFCERLIFVSTSLLSDEETAKIEKLVDRFQIKENEGYDFKSWQVGFRLAGDLSQFDEVLICNDSVYGPLFDLGTVFSKMESVDCDFWGLTNSYEIQEHVQSFFVSFKSQVIRSEAFSSFWADIRPQETKHDVVLKYELGLTQILLKNGFHYRVVSEYRRTRGLLTLPMAMMSKLKMEWFGKSPLYSLTGHSGTKPGAFALNRYARLIVSKFLSLTFNPTVYHWREVIADGCPFIKVAILRESAVHVSVRGWQKLVSDFHFMPVELVVEHLKRTKV